jgi:hypothetical protein
MDDLVNKPLTHLFIATHSFGDKIEAKLKQRIKHSMQIKQLKDFITKDN